MKILWYKSFSAKRPSEIDYESSPTTVFLHRKIKETEREGVKWYEYDEAKLTPAEYSVYAAEQAREDNLAIMAALTDIYDLIGGDK